MNFSLFLPEIILSLSILYFLCVMVFGKTLNLKSLCVTAGILSLAALVATCFTYNVSGDLFHGTYRVDMLSQCFKSLILLGLFFSIWVSAINISIPEKRLGEYFFFLFSSALGMLMIPSSVNLLTLYVAMELSSYALYLLTAIRLGKNNAEASVKYLIFGAISSGIFLWGASLLLGLTGHASFNDIGLAISIGGPNIAALLTATVFVLFAFLFKLSCFPVFFWAPDTYEASATPVSSFIATASKAAAISALVRFLMITGVSAELATILGAFSFLSMTLGNTVALVQKDAKRLLAYSSIAQAGYILLGLLSGTPEGYAMSLFYGFAYVLMSAAAFFVVAIVAKSENVDNPQLEHFNGLAERSPKVALLLLLSLLSLAGIPPLVGFTGKWVLFTASMIQGHWFLVLWAVLNSVVSLFYYLSLVKHAYVEKSKWSTPIYVSKLNMLMVLALMAAIVLLGIFPDYFISMAQKTLALAMAP